MVGIIWLNCDVKFGKNFFSCFKRVWFLVFMEVNFDVWEMMLLIFDLLYGLDFNVVRSLLNRFFGFLVGFKFVKLMNDGVDSFFFWRICMRLSSMEMVLIERYDFFGLEGK